MREPGFWQHDGLLPRLLQPIATLYGTAARWRVVSASVERVPVPTICIGGATVGGSGKTPVAMSIAELLRSTGRKPHVVLRGYGGSLHGPVRVDPAKHDASMVGDEALLHAAAGPTWIARRRIDGARAAVAAGAGSVVLDDALQHHGIGWSRALLVVDGSYGIGNGRTLPAGPLRQPWTDVLDAADAIVLLGEDRAGMLDRCAAKPVFRAFIEPDGDCSDLVARPVLAFAGIARPERFRAALHELGADVRRFVAFADHHMFRERELFRLQAIASRERLAMVTTAKDAMRIPLGWQARLSVLRIRLIWRDLPKVTAFLAVS